MHVYRQSTPSPLSSSPSHALPRHHPCVNVRHSIIMIMMSTDTALPEASCPGAPWSHTRPLAWPGCATGRDYVSTCQNELGTISLGLEQQRIRPTVASAGRIPRTCTRDASSTPSLLPA